MYPGRSVSQRTYTGLVPYRSAPFCPTNWNWLSFTETKRVLFRPHLNYQFL